MRNVPACQRNHIGVGCGSPSARTVVSQATFSADSLCFTWGLISIDIGAPSFGKDAGARSKERHPNPPANGQPLPPKNIGSMRGLPAPGRASPSRVETVAFRPSTTSWLRERWNLVLPDQGAEFRLGDVVVFKFPP